MAKKRNKKLSRAVADVLKGHRTWVEAKTKERLAKKKKRDDKDGDGHPDVPLSESLAPAIHARLAQAVQDKMTEDDVVALLRGMAENDPDRVISRNYFRTHGRIKESTWNQFFGTFEEFKRQAGIKLSRQQHKLEREIAKHASVDHYRALEKERVVWGNKYEKPSHGRFKTILVGSDFHDVDCDPFALRVFLDVARRSKSIIDLVCLAGDLFDLPEFGRWAQDPRDWDVAGRIRFVHNSILAPLRKILGYKVQIDLIEGNHEARILRHLADATPAMKGLLADLHGFDIPKLLGLTEYEVNYIGKGSLVAWSQADMNKELEHNYKVYYGSVLAHHFPNLGRRKGLPGFSGHHHKLKVWPLENPLHGPGLWYQLGAMHVRSASYADGQPWTNGFALVHVDTLTKRSTFEYFDISDHCYAGGKLYLRQEEENVVPTVPGLKL